MPITFQNVTITGGLQLVSAGVAPPSGDPDWANVSLLMNTTSTNAQTNNTFLDSSAAGLTITRFGSPTQGSITPFTVANGTNYSTATNGGSSSLAGGGQYLKSVASAGLSFNGDFTIECWVKTTTISLDPYGRRIWSFGSAGTAAEIDLDFYNGSAITTNACVSVGNVGAVIVGTIAVADGNWHHVAVTRSGSSIKLFVDGVQSGSTYTSSATFSAGATNGMYVGSLGSVGGYFVGNISSLRVVKGTAVYTSAFTPPTAPLTAISGTSLLLNYTNAGMYDAATKNNLLGVGDTKVSTTQSKFAPTSVFFDGTGDSLQTPSTAILYPTISDDFTAEMWAYPATPQEFAILMGFNSSTVAAPWVLRISFSALEIILGNSSINQGTVTVNQWNHIAFTKSGSTVRLFLNGVQQGSNATVSSITVGGMNFTIGDWSNGGRPFNGYIQDVRITKGVARYTANFTPPTAAFPTN
jgi:hypothetical protein